MEAELQGFGYYDVLISLGIDALLVETNDLGGSQSLLSQGIIHGGMKYTLSGKVTQDSEAVANMPERWRKCLKGEDDVKLNNVKILSHYQYLWSNGSLKAQLIAFFAKKALRSRIEELKKEQFPKIFLPR